MPKVQFTFPVKYLGKYYKAFQTFDARQADLTMLQKQGAVLISENTETVEVPKKKSPQHKSSKSSGRLND